MKFKTTFPGVYNFLVACIRKIQKVKNSANEKREFNKRRFFYSSFIKPGQLVFDVGANMGNRIDIFTELTSSVVAVEPQPACIAALKKRFGNKIKIEEVGLADKPGELEMFIADESTISTFSKEFADTLKETRFKRNNWDNKIKVPITTLDALIEKHGVPHFCKIDVEGFEYEVLSGLNMALPLISFEYCVPEFTNKVIDCINRLHKLDSNLRYNFSKEETMQWEHGAWFDYAEFYELVQSPAFTATQFGDIYVKKADTIINQTA
jgi:FkbM family methyltransferase